MWSNFRPARLRSEKTPPWVDPCPSGTHWRRLQTSDPQRRPEAQSDPPRALALPPCPRQGHSGATIADGGRNQLSVQWLDADCQNGSLRLRWGWGGPKTRGMATITSISDALAQYTAALPWQASTAAAQSALDAIRYLLVNRVQNLSDSQTGLSYESLESEKTALEKFLGVTTPRAFGRRRRNGVSFQSGGIG